MSTAAVPKGTQGPQSLSKAFANAYERWGGRPALSGADTTVSFAELGACARSLAGAYARLGIRAGDRVACSVSNRPEAIIALAGAWAHGAIHVAADYQFTARELLRVLERTDARALVYEPPRDSDDPLEFVRAIRRARSDLIIILVGSSGENGCEQFADLAHGDARGGGEARPAAQHPAVVFVSSGTTGLPKTTIGFHGNLAGRWGRLGPWLGFDANDVHLAQMPIAHGFGLTMAVSALLQGGSIILLPRHSTSEVVSSIAREKVTVIAGAPTHYRLLLNRVKPGGGQLASLRLGIGTAASFQPSLVREIWKRLQIELVVMYGSSEGVGVATRDREDILGGAVGRIQPGSVQIVDPDDHTPLPEPEQIGELAFSRRVFPVALWGEEPGDEEWFYSGDRGRLDEAGRLYVYGRLKNQIDRGGLKVDPLEVEAVLLECPHVLDGAVLGMPDPVLGEVVCACVVTGGEEPQPRLEELRQLMGQALAPYKLPDELRALTEIPRTPVGKVDGWRLRTMLGSVPHAIERARTQGGTGPLRAA